MVPDAASASYSDSYTITANRVLQIFCTKICLNVLHCKYLEERFILLVYCQTQKLLNPV